MAGGSAGSVIIEGCSSIERPLPPPIILMPRQSSRRNRVRFLLKTPHRVRDVERSSWRSFPHLLRARLRRRLRLPTNLAIQWRMPFHHGGFIDSGSPHTAAADRPLPVGNGGHLPPTNDRGLVTGNRTADPRAGGFADSSEGRPSPYPPAPSRHASDARRCALVRPSAVRRMMDVGIRPSVFTER